MYPCHNYSGLHSMKIRYFWIIYWEDYISLGPPLEHWHTGAVVGLSRLCAQAASLQGQTAFCIFMAGFTTGKWSFPGLWRQWRGWSGNMEGPSAQHEMLKTAWGCLILRNGVQHLFSSQSTGLSVSHTNTVLTPYRHSYSKTYSLIHQVDTKQTVIVVLLVVFVVAAWFTSED